MTSSFYRERILWRAEKHRLFLQRCIPYGDASDEQKHEIDRVLGGVSDGVLLFWDSPAKWTLLADSYIASWHHDALHRCTLDDIGKAISVPSLTGAADASAKSTADYLRLERPDLLIWAPAGKELFALMNILLMFPLNKSAVSSVAEG